MTKNPVSISEPVPNVRPYATPLTKLLLHLEDTTLDNGWWGTLGLDGTGAGTASLDGLDDTHGGGVVIRDGSEDDVAAIEPAGDDGGDEKLGAVAV